jgi:molybdopterin molybdotransferase
MTDPELGQGIEYAGFEEALAVVRANTRPVGTEERPLSTCHGYVTARDADALTDSPSFDASLKDGFAVKSRDVVDACLERPIALELAGSVFAGGKFEGVLGPGETLKVCTGAAIPPGADAVVSSEFCDEAGNKVLFRAGAGEGRNVMRAGEDVKAGTCVVGVGQLLRPARLAFAASAGIARLEVYRRPRVAVISVGDELVSPGQDLKEGSIYASNSVNIVAWLSSLSIPSTTATAVDSAESIRSCLESLSETADAIITNGGLMHSERDLVVGVLSDLGWGVRFRHVRMGPGKGTSFGLWRNKPVFCLSGGPTSSTTGFVSLALPGILGMAGLWGSVALTTSARLDGQIKGRNLDWTEFSQARLRRDEEGRLYAVPLPRASRSRSMADADCLLRKPEGVKCLNRGQMVWAHLMTPGVVGLIDFGPASRPQVRQRDDSAVV